MNREPDEVEHLLTTLSGQTRITRAHQISDQEVKITRIDDEVVEAIVKEYPVEIDIQGKTIRHTCPDWKKTAEERRLCKHINKLLLTLPKEKTKTILQNITQTLHKWNLTTHHRINSARG
ncbi:MAG: hypothetical protein QXD24_02030 [Candidatus Caldarchaeum sp.]|jgi:hypothetical protein